MDIEQECQQLLAELRSDRAAWARIAYQPDENGADQNRSLRARVLVALYRTGGEADHDLAVFALEQETCLHRTLVTVSHFMMLAAYLVASYRRPQNAPLLFRARMCSMSTGMCLAHPGIVFSGGFQESLAAVEQCGDAERKHAFFEMLREGAILRPPTEADLESWPEYLRQRFAELLSPDVLKRASLAASLGFLEEANRLLEQAEREGPRTEAALHALVFQLEMLGRFDRSIPLRRALIDLAYQAKSCLLDSDICFLADAHAKLGDYVSAWGTLLWAANVKESGPLLTGWTPLVERSFDIVIGAGPGCAVSHAAFAWAHRKLVEGCAITRNLVQKGIRAAETMNDAEFARKCHELLAYMQAQWDAGRMVSHYAQPKGVFVP